MMRKIVAATILAAFASSQVWAASPMDFKGKMKEGLYEVTVNMEMSGVQGMPQGMKMPGTTVQHCITKKDIEEGNQKMLGGGGPRGEMPKDCEMKDFKISGDTASYKMVCTGENKMEIDSTMTFTGTGYKAVQKMKMNQGGQVMNMNSNIESKFIGACKS